LRHGEKKVLMGVKKVVAFSGASMPYEVQGNMDLAHPSKPLA